MLPNSDSPTVAAHDTHFSRVLLIRQNLHATVHRDALLKQFGFIVEVAVPTEVPEIVNDGIASYSVVVISDSLAPSDVREVAEHVRQASPRTRIVLVEGPDSVPTDPRLYDTLVDSWSGPIAFINAVQRLVAS
jgi:hypothetical protein